MSEKSDLSELRERVSALVPSDETVRHAVPSLYWPVWARVLGPLGAVAAKSPIVVLARIVHGVV